MSTLIKGQMAALGLVILLAGPVSGQTDSAAGGSAVPAGRHIHFSDVTSRSNNDGKHQTLMVRATDDNGNTYRMRKSDDRVVGLEVNGKSVSPEQNSRIVDLLSDLGQPPTPPVPPIPPVGPAAPAVAATPAPPAAPIAPVVPAVAPVGEPVPPGPVAAPMVPTPPASPLPPTPPAPPEPPRANKNISRIIDELIDKGIINDDNRLSFSLDNEQLTVNGAKQPDAVFQAFRQKYIKHAGDHFRYEHSATSTISSIKTDDDNH